MKRISDFFKSIPSEVRLSKAELLLTVAVSSLTGVVAGMLISPRKEHVLYVTLLNSMSSVFNRLGTIYRSRQHYIFTP